MVVVDVNDGERPWPWQSEPWILDQPIGLWWSRGWSWDLSSACCWHCWHWSIMEEDNDNATCFWMFQRKAIIGKDSGRHSGNCHWQQSLLWYSLQVFTGYPCNFISTTSLLSIYLARYLVASIVSKFYACDDVPKIHETLGVWYVNSR